MEETKKLPQKWINTPFAFTRLSKNLSLLQQAVLVKVSEQLQPFIKEFFGSDLAKSRKVPKSLFSEAVKNSGVTQIYISYAELGVPENNFFAVKQAMKEVLDVKVEGPKKNDDGSMGMHMYNVFLSGETSIKNTGVVFGLNPQVIDPDKHLYVLDYAFNMVEGYVSHPDNIALIGEVARMPMIYYILRDASGNNWKERSIQLTVSKIKKYLGMMEFSGAEIVKEAYPKFSQFKKNVLDNSIADINRLKQLGQIDVCISYEPIYNGKRKVGNPAYIEFSIYDTIEQMQQALAKKQKVQQPISLFDEEVKPGESEWQQLVAMLDGEIGEELRKVVFVSYDGKTILLKASREQCKKVESCLSDDVIAHVKDCSKQVFGKVIKWNYSLSDN
ncbi:MAG: RepB family plasmid replication initiator protein [Prevotella sp.]|nr:RepB family plasmid replication initiator protein [Prevotella sp.]